MKNNYPIYRYVLVSALLLVLTLFVSPALAKAVKFWEVVASILGIQ